MYYYVQILLHKKDVNKTVIIQVKKNIYNSDT